MLLYRGKQYYSTQYWTNITVVKVSQVPVLVVELESTIGRLARMSYVIRRKKDKLGKRAKIDKRESI
jgi:hypothetical protein